MVFSNDALPLFQSAPPFVSCIDSHTEGESTRLIVDGVEPVPGDTMMDKLQFFRSRHDDIRCLLTKEPRGSRSILAALVTENVTPDAAFGLIYMDAKRYPYLCGHATIGAVVTLAKTGFLVLEEGDNQVLVDTPSGIMDARATVCNGAVTSVAVHMVPSFVHSVGQSVQVDGFGSVPVDIVCTGGFFAMVDADVLGIPPVMDNRETLVDLGMKIIDAANDQLSVVHPLNSRVNTVDVTEFYTSEYGDPAPWGRGMVVYGEAHMDRSPCGTGTAAKLALLHHHGRLDMHQPYKNLSPMDTVFDAELVEKTNVGPREAYVTRIRGRAWVTGRHDFCLDADDPFQQGYLI